MKEEDHFGLRRFVEAQEPIFQRVVQELREGYKSSHWMWFVFPQIQGLGRSPMAERYAICSLEEARAYLEHPVLGPRLRECTKFVNVVSGRSIEEIFGEPDDLKFRSCMTLFAQAADDKKVFLDALQKYFGGEFDPLTMNRLGFR